MLPEEVSINLKLLRYINFKSFRFKNFKLKWPNSFITKITVKHRINCFLLLGYLKLSQLMYHVIKRRLYESLRLSDY
ncbi:hypothetical protein EB651_05440 [Escherichia coli]|nr:hypothetical protein [Escherichia coli]